MSLLEKSFSAFLWGTTGTFVKLSVQLGSQVVLARLLGPEQYGIFAIGVIVISFANFLGDFGISYGLIQKKSVSNDDIRYVLAWQLLIGGVVAGLVVLGASVIAEFFKEPSCAWVIRALALVCIANSLCSVSMNLLKRALDYKAMHIAQVTGHVVGYLFVGIPLAFLGFDVVSLVAAWIIQALVQLAVMYRSVRHPLIPTLSHVEGWSMLIYGRNVLIANLTNWGLANTDRVFVGKRFALSDIGQYAVSSNLLYNGTSALLAVIQSISFSASSKVQDNLSTQRRIFLGVSGGSLLLVGPVFSGLAAVSDTFILTLYGDKWRSAGDIFTPIALAMPLFVLWGLSTPLLWIAGKGKLEGMLNLPLLCLWFMIIYLSSLFSPQATAWSVLLLYFLRTGLFVSITAKALHMNLFSYFRTCLPGLIISMIVAASLMGTDFFLRELSLLPIVSLLVEFLIGLISWRIGFHLVRALLSPTIHQVLASFSSRLPSWLAILLFGNMSNVR